jgi:prepilin-type N-terminal cleavage/methylation domain-containing protein
MQNVKKCGFTLIEMAIVLVIIALLVGGVMAGRNMIVAAKMRAQITDLQKYKTAVKLFDEMYKGIPGDITNATTLFGATTANGDGDGFIETTTIAPWGIGNISPDNGYYDGERPHFFMQLSLSGMIEKKFNGTAIIGNGYPGSILNKNGGFFAAGSWHTAGGASNTMYSNIDLIANSSLYLASINDKANFPSASNHNDTTGTFTPAELWEIDKKIDDSIPSSGKILAVVWSPTISCGNATTYNLAGGENRECNMLYDLTD